jgi:DNA-binding NarL/FixJ family response regulator
MGDNPDGGRDLGVSSFDRPLIDSRRKGMIRVLTVDDHPALRAGVWAMLRSEPGFQPAGAVAEPAEALERAAAVRPDVALVDFRLGRGNGLQLCHDLRRLERPPRTLIYSAYGERVLTVPAMLAGACGVACKDSPPDVLMDSIRRVARGQRVFPPLTANWIRAASRKVPACDLPIFGMLVEGTAMEDVGSTLGLEAAEVSARIEAMIGRVAPKRRGTG